MLKIEELNKGFEGYVKNYDMSDPDINHKYKHSYRVMALAKNLAKKLRLSKKDIDLATIIGLYHDIGRFEEDRIFDDFNKHENFDHGNYGCKVLKKEGLINKIPIEKEYYDLIGKAVEQHNKYAIEEGLEEKTTLHCKIIRDADKIDILRSAAKGDISKKYFNNKVQAKDVSEDTKKHFYMNVQLKRVKRSKRIEADVVLVYLAFIYDINYSESLKYLLNNHVLEDFYNLLEDKEGYKEYFDHIEEYIKRRMSDVR